jgi:LysM repeat protein
VNTQDSQHPDFSSPTPSRILTRRRVLAGLGGAVAGLVLPRAFLAEAAGLPARPASPVQRALAGSAPRHLAWVWQFRHDGDPAEIRDTLAANGLGIVLKTHDGAEWMSRYDKSRTAVDGAKSVEAYANFFENAGVPFHAWSVTKGTSVKKEASIASDVLGAGARSLFLDVEAHAGFWVGTKDDAEQYGDLVRASRPNARISTSIDPRPWEIERIPLQQFADFTDEISPQVYWNAFANKANAVKYLLAGETVAPEDITPAFVMTTAMKKLRAFDRLVHPIGDGTTEGTTGWDEFIESSYTELAETVSVWRYGVASRDLWTLLRDTPPRVSVYEVQPGDTLGAIAARFNTTVPALVAVNGISNPNLISVGTRLVLPGGSAAVATPVGGGSSAARTHTVAPGDSLLAIAYRYDSSVEAIAGANGLTPPYLIRIAQVLRIP